MKFKKRLGMLSIGALLPLALAFAVGCDEKKPDTGDSGNSETTPPVTTTCTHETKEWSVYQAATCEEEGSEVLVCLECDEVFDIRSIEKVEHSYEDEYTCHDRKCKKCDYVDKARTEHTFSGAALETEVRTCVMDGYEKYQCSVCGDDVYEMIDAYNLYAGEVLEWRTGITTSADIQIEKGVAAYTVINERGYASSSKMIYFKSTDWLVLDIESGTFTLKLIGENYPEKVLVNSATAGYYKFPMSEWIQTEGYYDLFVYIEGTIGTKGVINELSLLSSKDEVYHAFNAENVCEHCESEKPNDSLLSNYGYLYAEEFEERWTGNKYFTADEKGATYSLNGKTTWVDSYVRVGLRTTDYLSCEIVNGKFRLIIKRVGYKEIDIGSFGPGKYRFALRDYIEEDDNYQFWVVGLTDKGVEIEDRINALTLSEDEPIVENYGYLYDSSFIWTGTEYFTIDGEGKTATYTLDGSVTYTDSYLNVFIKPTDYISFAIEVENCTGISFMLKQADGSGEFYKETYQTGVFKLFAKDLGVSKTGLYRLQVSPLTQLSVSGTVTVKNLCLETGDALAENYGNLLSEPYASRWTTSHMSSGDAFTIENGGATYTLDGDGTWFDTIITLKLKETDYLTFTISETNCDKGITLVLRSADGSVEYVKKTYGQQSTSGGRFVISVADLGVTEEGTYQLWVAPITSDSPAYYKVSEITLYATKPEEN